ncbi:MAG: hypothetical protein OXE53_11010 [Deltaproteobacteria bacterium]|nr:hypothetical protein [Deltaproteobacteria bacterium]
MADSRESMGERAAREVGVLLGKCAAGEAEVAATYFSRPRPREDHVRFLMQQTGRELTRVFQLGGLLANQLAGLGVTVDRHTYLETLAKLHEETNHYVMCHDVLAWFTGEQPFIGELRRYDIFNPDPTLPENEASIRLSREKKAIEDELAAEAAPWARLVGDEGVLEGGGAGTFFACSRIEGGEFERRLAEAMKVVLADELRHGADQLERFHDLELAEEDLERIKGYVKRHGDARVRFRNAQFNYPLSEERMREIEAGEIEPLYVWEEAGRSAP